MSNYYILIAVMAVILVAASIPVLAAMRRKNKAQKRLKEIGSDRAVERKSGGKKNKKNVISTENFEKSGLASNSGLKKMTSTIANELTSAGLGDDPIRVLLMWIIIVIILPLIENLMGVNFWAILTTILVSAAGPVLYIRISKAKRQEKFEKQLPHAIDIICNALKAGYSFQYSMNNVAKELEDPISEEFLMAFRETQYGASLTTALDNMAKRTASPDMELLNIAVSVQSNIGGNMIEILENISSTLTTKHDLEADIKVKTASGKITGILLTALPIVLMLALNIINPDYLSIFFKETIGHYMLAFCAIWEIIGFLVIRKILNVKF